MTTVLGLSGDFRYVLAVAVSTGFLSFWQSLKVSAARKVAGVKYPAQYAPDADAQKDIKAMKFNCAQRAHGNTLESLPFFLFSLIYVGLSKPVTAAVLGALWVSGRVLYTIGYTSGIPSNRMWGVHHNIGHLGLMFTAAYITAESFM
ncbi:hypothetical protein BCR35DRAFT_310080 [Leucosporidium creatinivorum]|uniref:Membrane-associated proteins in eicosanoid and glutathione metabolism n=1 Tax=Leucosporidium creatinivorum TaxID=106004 RepID=A0A1Y2D7R2_9BASI|nr:hypothetical protein BCR35DRAFT_310080 [Leucosporidium creatinivorum]